MSSSKKEKTRFVNFGTKLLEQKFTATLTYSQIVEILRVLGPDRLDITVALQQSEVKP